MDTTKTAVHQRIALPPEIIDILKWHADRLPSGPMRDSEFLFPSETGGFRSASCLDKVFADVTKQLGVKKHITPRAMRRTFQDLARAAQVKDVVTRTSSGHATEVMQYHYSTVDQAEVRAGLAKVISLAGVSAAWKKAA